MIVKAPTLAGPHPERKKDASLHGSTDVECYDPLWCSEYCCDKQSGAPGDITIVTVDQ